jgi:hypothetical protein
VKSEPYRFDFCLDGISIYTKFAELPAFVVPDADTQSGQLPPSASVYNLNRRSDHSSVFPYPAV